MNRSSILLILACCWLASACATFPKHIPSTLLGPQARSPFVTAGTDSSGMIVWKQPAVTIPAPQTNMGTKSIEKCGGEVGKFLAEWQDVNGSQMQLIHGKAAASEFSGYDFWGTHRYHDWNVLLVVNQGYDAFLGPANFISFGGWGDDAVAQYLFLKNPELDGLVELEWDSGFFAPEMAPTAGDETLVVGRWAYDCGHEDEETSSSEHTLGFRAEIHAPEILMSSHILQSDSTTVHANFKIFAGSRSGPLNTIPLIFYVQKFFASYKNPLGGKDYSIGLRAPGDGWKIASCRLTPGTPAGGRARRITGNIGSDDGGTSLTFTLSAKDLKPTARIESSMMVDVTWVRSDSSRGRGITKCE